MKANFASVLCVALVVGLAGCGSSNPAGPSGGGSGGSSGSPGPSGATITITSAGVNPKSVTVAVGQSVTFVNNDAIGHQIASNPHPVHTDCPAINAVATIASGQTKLTNAFTTARSCGFHDHNNPDNAALQGTIVIQ